MSRRWLLFLPSALALAAAVGWVAPVRAESPLEAIQPLVLIEPQTRGSEVMLHAQLRDCLCACLHVDLDLQNMRASVPTPILRDLVQPRTTLGVLRAVDPFKRWRYSYRIHYFIGRRGARPDFGHVYRTPFSRVTRYRVAQGFGGSFSHQAGTPFEYSVDWEMPEGTEVLAARAGQVVGFRADQLGGGTSAYYRDRANFVIVEHGDGTLAEYVHLRPGGVAARLGQRVEPGDLLGYSGNTGFSSRPHLHVRIYFLDAAGEPRGLPVRWDVHELYDPPQRLAELPFRLPVLQYLGLRAR